MKRMFSKEIPLDRSIKSRVSGIQEEKDEYLDSSPNTRNEGPIINKT